MLRGSPFDHLRRALDADDTPEPEVGGVRADILRAERCGIPEIVYCHGKSVEAIATACKRLADRGTRVLATRCDPALVQALQQDLQSAGLQVQYVPVAKTLMVQREDASEPPDAGTIGLLTAGTSDWSVAVVAKMVAEAAGCRVLAFQDCGVAGLHRLVEPLEALVREDVPVIIVAAGMDGVLPSVVAGLVDIPVIALPTSTGYGHGGGGEGALTTMLQSCAPGVAVVNIDNGVGAGSMAALIAMRVSRERSTQQPGGG
ncbi:MAG: nickel pincer cofactor biosynthesis protein LarB [Thermomicrobiales bacterium]